MHDISYIRENPIEFDNSIKKRGESASSEKILKLDEDKRKAQTHLQELLSNKNKLSKEVGNLKSKNKDANSLISKVDNLSFSGVSIILS